jgi:hypothetical protein
MIKGGIAMIKRKGIRSKSGLILLAFGFVLLLALPGWGDDDICSLCDESSVKIGFGSSAGSHERWYDLSSVFRLGNQIMVSTDNPRDKPDKPNIVIYASFDSKQSIKVSPQYGTCPCENQGHRATLSVAEYNITFEADLRNLAFKLKAEGVPKRLLADLMGPYIYRINILAPDFGLYATSLLSLTNAANYAVGEALVDHYRIDDMERARICNYLGSVVKRMDIETKGADDVSQQALPPVAGKYGHTSPLMALIK